ncbi:DNA-3-methyladenine glycosylase [Paenarthrobacter sp. DKR-5]|uniref:DNA-3-methyladenine glycosylase n=1 Tax=Paenarthrobacter sp. DKR-5 TaxID=2835535 RepID=UPI0027DC1B1E|nr:DNA-3-methyladenine glycosylase [Paenarthrobacter sp. DKR-5]
MGESEHSKLLAVLEKGSVAAAPRLLGAVLRHTTEEGTVGVRITEVEAYRGPANSEFPDPGSHSFRGRTARNEVMFGPPGHLYVYFTYGMHYCANVVCSPEGTSSGVLLRAGEVIEGTELARSRRPAVSRLRDLARGPARLASALGLGRGDNGAPLGTPALGLVLGEHHPLAQIASGPRVGVAGEGGTTEYPWRFWIKGDPTVSVYRAAKPRTVRKER